MNSFEVTNSNIYQDLILFRLNSQQRLVSHNKEGNIFLNELGLAFKHNSYMWELIPDLANTEFQKSLEEAKNSKSGVIKDYYLSCISGILRLIITFINDEYMVYAIKKHTNNGIVLTDSKFRIVSFNGQSEQLINLLFRKFITKGADFRDYFLPVYQYELFDVLDKIHEKKQSNRNYELILKSGFQQNVILINVLTESETDEIFGYIFTLLEPINNDVKTEVSIAGGIQSEANRELEQFIYIVSHNLKSSISKIKGLFGLLQNGDNEKNKDYIIKGIESSIGKLDNTIMDVNDIISINKKIEDKYQAVSFEDMIKIVVSDLDDTIKTKNASICYDFKSCSHMKTYKPYLQSIFYNIISNSLKYSRKEADPTIIVKSNITNNQIELSFSDNGIGIDMNRHGNELFGLYKRFNDTEEGKGMGLFMVKSQIHAIGGQIAIQSELNKGTLFKITLPLA